MQAGARHCLGETCVIDYLTVARCFKTFLQRVLSHCTGTSRLHSCTRLCSSTLPSERCCCPSELYALPTASSRLKCHSDMIRTASRPTLLGAQTGNDSSTYGRYDPIDAKMYPALCLLITSPFPLQCLWHVLTERSQRPGPVLHRPSLHHRQHAAPGLPLLRDQRLQPGRERQITCVQHCDKGAGP